MAERRAGLFAALTTTDRIYLISRGGMAAAVTVLYAAGVFRFEGQDSAVHQGVFIGGMIGLVAAGVFGLVALLALRQTSQRVMWEILPLDLVAAGMLVYSTSVNADPFYPWMLGLSIAYTTAIRRRMTWIVAGLAATVYLGAHYLAGHAAMAPADFEMLVFKAGGLVFTGLLMADTMHRQEVHDEALLSNEEEVRELNLQLGQRLAELHAVSEITEVIHSTLDFDDVGPLVLDILSKVIDLPSSCIFVIDKDKAETLFSASAGLSSTVAQTYSQRYAYAALDAEATVPDDLFACTNVLDHGDLMVVFCAPGDALERMRAEDRLVLQAVASELVVAVENSRLYKLTKRLSITDELTGLYNYRYLQQRLEDEIERARRYQRSLSLLMLDADNFKRFNDTHGHIAGDAALAELGATIAAAVREIDVVCRYGGEEFSIVLPETDAEGAFVVAEKVREAVASHSFADASGERGVHISVSIGLATFPSTAVDREELLRQADDALYQAKDTGRDRVRAPRGVEPPAPAAATPESAATVADKRWVPTEPRKKKE